MVINSLCQFRKKIMQVKKKKEKTTLQITGLNKSTWEVVLLACAGRFVQQMQD